MAPLACGSAEPDMHVSEAATPARTSLVRVASGISWGPWLLLVALAVFVLSPVVLVVVGAFQDPLIHTWTLDAFRRFRTQPVPTTAVWNTAVLTIVVQLISLPAALFISWLLARTDMPFNRGLEFMFWIAFFLPALPVTLGWILLLDPSYGLVNSALRSI